MVFLAGPATWNQPLADASWETFSERSQYGFRKRVNRKEVFRSNLYLRRRITHGNHPRSLCLMRIFQCLAVPRQPLKLLETLEIRVLKSLMLPVRTGSISASFNKPYAECD